LAALGILAADDVIDGGLVVAGGPLEMLQLLLQLRKTARVFGQGRRRFGRRWRRLCSRRCREQQRTAQRQLLHQIVHTQSPHGGIYWLVPPVSLSAASSLSTSWNSSSMSFNS